MSFEAHFDHTVTVYRPSETKGTHGAVSDTYAAISGETDVKALIQSRSEVLADPGPGELVAGKYFGAMRVAADVQEQDVLDVTKGPESPLKLLVIGRTRPRGRHTELELRTWDGKLS